MREDVSREKLTLKADNVCLKMVQNFIVSLKGIPAVRTDIYEQYRAS
jgi:hypothetical protein